MPDRGTVPISTVAVVCAPRDPTASACEGQEDPHRWTRGCLQPIG